MNVKKYTNNTWQEITPYKYSTSVETYTDLPQIIYANGNSASIGLKGASSLSGVPSPTNPIQPQGCGDLETTGVHAGQYKIPISSASTTTPVYLGEVETTRKVKKLVLTGEEQWEMHPSVMSLFRSVYINDYLFNESNIILCTHYRSIVNTGAAGVSNGETCFYYNTASTARIIYIKDETFTSAADFKSYLAAQYAAGTPVTVWYVLANEETAVVNEPLMRIGDYADTVSGITIPTITGRDTFDVETTLKPSEVELTYTGWHDATVKEWDGSQWNE